MKSCNTFKDNFISKRQKPPISEVVIILTDFLHSITLFIFIFSYLRYVCKRTVLVCESDCDSDSTSISVYPPTTSQPRSFKPEWLRGGGRQEGRGEALTRAICRHHFGKKKPHKKSVMAIRFWGRGALIVNSSYILHLDYSCKNCSVLPSFCLIDCLPVCPSVFLTGYTYINYFGQSLPLI